MTLPKPVDLAQIAYKERINDEYLKKFETLEDLLHEFDWVEEQKSQQQELIKSLDREVLRLELDIKTWGEKKEKEKHQVEEMKKLTWTSFRARLSGNHEKKMEKEEEEYLEAVQRHDDAVVELEKIKSRLEVAHKDLQDIIKAEKKREQIKKLQADLIYHATEGIKDPVEDQIEIDINELGKVLDPYTVRKSKIQTAYSFLQMASEYLRDASIRIEKEPPEQQNALLIDTLTKSDVADLRQVVKDASSYLNQAYEIMEQQFEDPTADVREGEEHRGLFQGQSQIWERFVKNFMQDLKKGFRSREETKKQLIRARSDINKLQSWISSLLNDINFKINELMDELRIKEKDLVRERTRIFKSYLANKSENV